MKIEELIERCESATGPDRELDAEIAIELFDGGADHLDDARDVTRARRVLISHGAQPGNFEVVGFSGVSLRTAPAYTSSLDAAMTLIPQGWAFDLLFNIDGRGGVEAWRPDQTRSSFDNPDAVTPALALCAAALRARTHP